MKSKRFDASTAGLTDALRFIVDEAGMTRYEISQLTNASESLLSRNYHGTQGIPINRLAEIAEAVEGEIFITVRVPARKKRKKA